MPRFQTLLAALFLSALLAIAACSGDGGPPPLASIAATPGSVSLSFIGETATLTLTITDESGATRTDVTVEWTSSNPSVVSVSAEGVATAVGNGTVVLQASAGGVTSNPVTATVSQEAASIEVSGGPLSFSFLGETGQLSASAVDQGGTPVQGASLSWSSSNNAVASVDASGTVTAVGNGTASIRANADGVNSSGVSVVVEQAVSVVTPVTNVLRLTFLGETAQLEIVAEDAGGSAITDAVAEWTSSTPSVATVDASGIVKAVTEGTTEVTATVDGVTSGVMVVTVELGSALGDRITGLAAQQGDQLLFKVTVPEGTGELIVGIGNGNDGEDADLFVRRSQPPTREVFDCVDGNEFADELCELPNPAAGEWFILVDAFSAFTDLDFLAFTRDAAPGLHIDFNLGSGVTPELKELLEAAAVRWEAALPTELFGIWAVADDACVVPGFGGFDIDGPIEDIVVRADVVTMDGAGGVLAIGGPCGPRPPGAPNELLPLAGVILIDQADSSRDDLFSTVLHELGHVLGFGTLWSEDGFPTYIEGAGTSDPIFTGPLARDAFDEVGGISFSGAKVPLENTGGDGTRDGHWRESVFDDELMTGFAEGSGTEALSIVTLQAMSDLGWTADLSQADAYVLPGSGSSSAAVAARAEPLNDILEVRPLTLRWAPRKWAKKRTRP